ncbi:MAG: hypothetical protein ACI9WU_005044 [Myxococcota bacterium]|jgi:hypothetical protein
MDMRWIALMSLLVGLGAPASASAGAKSKPSARKGAKRQKPLMQMEWAVRVRGHVIGQAKLAVGGLQSRQGVKVRPVKFEADIRPTGLSIFKFAGKANTWVKKGWTPVSADWKWQELTKRSEVKATWKGNKLDGRWFLGGKERRRIRADSKRGHFSDVVSVLPWLMHQDLKEGKTIKTTTFTGNQVYRVTGKVGAKGKVALPGGDQEALPVAFTAVRPGKTRTFTVWVDPATKTPLRLVFKYALLGEVDAVLVKSTRRKPTAKKAAAGKTVLRAAQI